MDSDKVATEEDVFDLQIGLGETQVADEDKHFFDIAGYIVLEDLLTGAQVEEAREQLADRASAAMAGDYGDELLHIIEGGGVLEDAMALARPIDYVQEFIWGRQYRLVGSRAWLRSAGQASSLKQGGSADTRRYARYRCFGDGQFRCLMLTLFIALDDTDSGDGALCVVPGSHKVKFAHPYEDADLEEIAALCSIPLRAGSGVLLTENLSFAFKAPSATRQRWLAYHYGPSYMVNWLGCDPSAELLERAAGDPLKSHMLLKPYYHPEGAQKKKKTE
tara:strand:- start:393 stop:1220 length:828 start_codon:yes stop_codon:yes gene_type:complete